MDSLITAAARALAAGGLACEGARRRASDARVLESLEMPPGVAVSGLESDGGDRFFCGGATSEKVRAIRQAKPDRATKSRAAGR